MCVSERERERESGATAVLPRWRHRPGERGYSHGWAWGGRADSNGGKRGKEEKK